tara:strand:+ start:3632 stop:3808 length:177 start_codon:yes stop_codon:yes gene_type:complete
MKIYRIGLTVRNLLHVEAKNMADAEIKAENLDDQQLLQLLKEAEYAIDFVEEVDKAGK